MEFIFILKVVLYVAAGFVAVSFLVIFGETFAHWLGRKMPSLDRASKFETLKKIKKAPHE